MPTVTIEVQAIVPVLQQAVAERGLSQRALGQQLDVSPQTAAAVGAHAAVLARSAADRRRQDG